MASVPTGMPAGIWTIDSSESSPFSVFDCTGTPSTGSEVFAAVMPGRCAAPPAPAMMTSRPRSRARAGVFEQQIRRAVRGDDADLERDAETLERIGRGLERLPVRRRAHDDADQWFHRSIVHCDTAVSVGVPAGLQQSAQQAKQLAAAAGARADRVPRAPVAPASATRRAAHAGATSRAATRQRDRPPAGGRATARCARARAARARSASCRCASAARIGSASILRISLPMYCFWRYSPPRR